MKTKKLNADKLKKLIGRAVVVKWVNPNDDWYYFRLERVDGETICLTGMTDDEGTQHQGEWVRASFNEFNDIKERT